MCVRACARVRELLSVCMSVCVYVCACVRMQGWGCLSLPEINSVYRLPPKNKRCSAGDASRCRTWRSTTSGWRRPVVAVLKLVLPRKWLRRVVGVELYDHAADPLESINIARAAPSELLGEMSALLHRHPVWDSL